MMGDLPTGFTTQIDVQDGSATSPLVPSLLPKLQGGLYLFQSYAEEEVT
jgi:hypothetical protein